MLKNLKTELIIKTSSSEAIFFSNKVWLNSKYIKTKQNRKLETKFFEFFQVFAPCKQTNL